MPSVSGPQHRFMEMVAHDPGAAKRVGVPQSVGQEFAEADKGKKFASKKKGDPPGNGKKFGASALAHALRQQPKESATGEGTTT